MKRHHLQTAHSHSGMDPAAARGPRRHLADGRSQRIRRPSESSTICLIELAGHHVRFSNLGLPAVDPAEIRKALGHRSRGGSVMRARRHEPVSTRPVKRKPAPRRTRHRAHRRRCRQRGVFQHEDGRGRAFHAQPGRPRERAHRGSRRESPTEEDRARDDGSPLRHHVRLHQPRSRTSTWLGACAARSPARARFRRFREAVDEDDALRRRWLAYRTKRHYHLALDWLHANLPTSLRAFELRSDYDWEPQSEAGPRRRQRKTRDRKSHGAHSSQDLQKLKRTRGRAENRLRPAAEAVDDAQPGHQADEASATDTPGEEVTASTS